MLGACLSSVITLEYWLSNLCCSKISWFRLCLFYFRNLRVLFFFSLFTCSFWRKTIMEIAKCMTCKYISVISNAKDIIHMLSACSPMVSFLSFCAWATNPSFKCKCFVKCRCLWKHVKIVVVLVYVLNAEVKDLCLKNCQRRVLRRQDWQLRTWPLDIQQRVFLFFCFWVSHFLSYLQVSTLQLIKHFD